MLFGYNLHTVVLKQVLFGYNLHTVVLKQVLFGYNLHTVVPVHVDIVVLMQVMFG